MILLIGIYIIVLLLFFFIMPISWQMYWDSPRYDFNNQLIKITQTKFFCKYLNFLFLHFFQLFV